MMKPSKHNQKGFTLVETLIAIFILALTVGALLTLASGGFFTIRYAKNDIVANNLLQESLEYLRNTRDTMAQQGSTWDDWKATFPQSCFDPAVGCSVNPYANASPAIFECSSDPCYMSYFSDAGFYGYPGSNIFSSTGPQQQTSFVRTITVQNPTIVDTADSQIIITAKMKWMNGLNEKSTTQSIILTKWNLQ